MNPAPVSQEDQKLAAVRRVLTWSRALVAEYETKLIPKALLKQKLHEWGELFAQREEAP